jgi:hypothetical protein
VRDDAGAMVANAMRSDAISNSTRQRTDLRQLALEWCRQMAAPEPGGFARIVALDAAVHDLAPDGSVLRGPEAVQDYFTTFATLSTPAACELLSTIVHGDRVALRWVMRFQAGHGGRDWQQTHVDGMSMLATRDGLVVESWHTYGRTSI